MYCPICFNDTLKIASSGVVKMTFDGKSKATSQFYFNLKEDSEKKTSQKLNEVVEEYFEYYSNFQNKTPIIEIEAYSLDFKCSNKCGMSASNKISVFNLVFHPATLNMIVEEAAKKYDLKVDPKFLKR